MSVSSGQKVDRTPRSRADTAAVRIGCVSFLNSKPLIDGLETGTDPVVKFDVPSRLLEDLEHDLADLVLCPVIDYQRSAAPLCIVPVGGIGCRGPTLTVRLYSRIDWPHATIVHADADSHTSVALMRVLLGERFGLRPEVVPYDARTHLADGRDAADPATMLLIGDKVVTHRPDAGKYPFEMDLGEAWHLLTGRPFVFAVWMARLGADLGAAPCVLLNNRVRNCSRIGEIVDRHAPSMGWPRELAMRYLGHWLRYEVGPEELSAMEHFWSLAGKWGVLGEIRPMVLWGS